MNTCRCRRSMSLCSWEPCGSVKCPIPPPAPSPPLQTTFPSSLLSYGVLALALQGTIKISTVNTVVYEYTSHPMFFVEVYQMVVEPSNGFPTPPDRAGGGTLCTGLCCSSLLLLFLERALSWASDKKKMQHTHMYIW